MAWDRYQAGIIYIGLNPAIERHTWRLIHWSLRKFPEIATERIFAPLTTLGARDVLASYSPETRAKITSLFMDFRSGSGFMNDIGRRARRGEPHAIRVPTLIVHSKFDGQVGPSHAEMLAALIPNARLLLSDAESHLMWVSPRWVEVERELDRFLEKD